MSEGLKVVLAGLSPKETAGKYNFGRYELEKRSTSIKMAHLSTLPPGIEITGYWVLLETHLPGQPAHSVGILLVDEGRDVLHLKLKPNWWIGMAEKCEADIWEELAAELQQLSKESGASKVMEWLAQSASHAIRIAEPHPIHFTDSEKTLDVLYINYIRTISNKRNLNSGVLANVRLLRRPQTWVAAVASVALTWQLVRLYDLSHTKMAPNESAPLQIAGTALPLFSDSFRRPTLPEVTFAQQYSPLVPLRKHRLQREPRARRQLQLFSNADNLRVVPVVRETPLLPPPLIVVSNATSANNSILPFGEPILPEFKHRNRLIRGLAVLAAPFKLLASTIVNQDSGY